MRGGEQTGGGNGDRDKTTSRSGLRHKGGRDKRQGDRHTDRQTQREKRGRETQRDDDRKKDKYTNAIHLFPYGSSHYSNSPPDNSGISNPRGISPVFLKKRKREKGRVAGVGEQRETDGDIQG